MLTIKDILDEYQKKLDSLDLELIISRVIQKPREFILAHPEMQVNSEQELVINNSIKRRIKKEPLAYILGNKEFYGFDFKVDKNVLIPRPETELLVELVAKNILQTKDHKPKTVIDIGTGSGNIIISIAKNLKEKNNYFGIDISAKALQVAKFNAKKNNTAKKIKFIEGNLLEPILNPKNYKLKTKNYFIVANLPYLSKKIYSRAAPDVKKFEPQSSLLSKKNGLGYYEGLFKQIKQLKKNYNALYIKCYLEISPEQKKPLEKMIKRYFPGNKVRFSKDLAKKWRVADFIL